jgi:hypothetical protein
MMGPMRAYVATTGVLFALILAAHVARVLTEGAALVREPVFIATSIVSLAVSVWAVALLRRPR